MLYTTSLTPELTDFSHQSFLRSGGLTDSFSLAVYSQMMLQKPHLFFACPIGPLHETFHLAKHSSLERLRAKLQAKLLLIQTSDD